MLLLCRELQGHAGGDHRPQDNADSGSAVASPGLVSKLLTPSCAQRAEENFVQLQSSVTSRSRPSPARRFTQRSCSPSHGQDATRAACKTPYDSPFLKAVLSRLN